MTCCNVIIPNNKIPLCILPMAECSGGPRTFWYFGYFLTIQWRKIIWFNLIFTTYQNYPLALTMLGSRPQVPRSRPCRHKNESPKDFVHSSRPRQGNVEFKTGLDPPTLVCNITCLMKMCTSSFLHPSNSYDHGFQCVVSFNYSISDEDLSFTISFFHQLNIDF